MSKSNPNETYTLDKIAQLTAIMNADEAYYNQDDPIMSDADYDRLRNDYIEKYGSEDLDYTPGDVNTGFKHFKHTNPVNSLAKVKESEPGKLSLMIQKLAPVVLELKYDGLTVVAYPNKDGSCKFVTRGNGEAGDVLPNFIEEYEKPGINMTGYPVRGEVYMDTETFREINTEKEIAGEELFKNKRNAAAGILRNKERSPYLNRLKYVVYDIMGYPDENAEEAKLAALHQSTKFSVTPFSVIYDTFQAIALIKSMYRENKSGNIPIDGIVIKSNKENSLKEFGATHHHPNNAVAWKAAPEAIKTKLLDIEWQVGRDRLTPVAIMEPVEIDGTMVSKASLHNWGNIRKLNLNRNDIVVIEKSNEIIPQIIKNEGHIASQDIRTTINEGILKPDRCPVCQVHLETRVAETSKFGDDVEIIYCPNLKCKEKVAQQIVYMARKDVLNIDGLSIETARKICNSFYITTPSDIFRLETSSLKTLAGFAKRSAEKLHTNIQEARSNVKLDKFVPACCVLNIGHDIGKKLAATYHTYQDLLRVCDEFHDDAELSSIDGIGPETAKILVSDEFTNAMKSLYRYVQPLDFEPPVVKDTEKQYHIAITGKFDQPRSVYEKMITDAGHIVAKSVSSTTTHLMIADVNSTSSKAKKAKDLGVMLIDEEMLKTLL